MNLLSIRLNVLIGHDPAALPAPPDALEALRDVEVTHSDREVSGFRISFAIGRSGPSDLFDHPLVTNPLMEVNSRVVLTAIFDIIPEVIMDGIVTRRDLIPGDQPGQGTLVLTGKDLSVALDREVRMTEHPGQDETIIANKIALSYPMYGMFPVVVPPLVVDQPIPIDRTPQQNCSDWAYLNKMAKRHGYVTYVEAGPAPMVNRLYWGPPGTTGLQQKTLSVNLGQESNVSSIRFAQCALATTTVEGRVKDRLTGQTLPVMGIVPSRPPLGLVPEHMAHFGKQRKVSLDTSGLSFPQAMGRAQAALDLSSDDTVTVSGTLDSVKYNGVLRARAPVDLRGAGFKFSGTYLVRSVTHKISGGNYTQDFTLSRAELGAKLPVVRVM